MPPKQKSWGETQTQECIRQFNLFQATKGKEGWDPAKHSDTEYVKTSVRRNQTIKPYLKKSLGGSAGNIDSSKAIRGYQRAASEWWVVLARSGIRRGASATWPSSVVVQPCAMS
jgi:hypothetical protein